MEELKLKDLKPGDRFRFVNGPRDSRVWVFQWFWRNKRNSLYAFCTHIYPFGVETGNNFTAGRLVEKVDEK